MSGYDLLVTGEHILSVRGEFVPAPPGAKYPGEHLFLNCTYKIDGQGDWPGILQQMRQDMSNLLRTITAEKLFGQAVSLCISFITNEKPSGRRLYRYSILAEAIPSSTEAIDVNFICRETRAIESSEVTEIADLIPAKR
jgi:hypothetical protein